jgi:hypothetical protein
MQPAVSERKVFDLAAISTPIHSTAEAQHVYYYAAAGPKNKRGGGISMKQVK